MIIAPHPIDEDERINELNNYKILDTIPEQDFDDFTLLAAEICNTPIALISLVDNDRQWFKSRHGLDATETPRDLAFCSHAILQDNVFIVEDSRNDDRFHDNPLVTNAPNAIFYCGAPLFTPNGKKIGTLCVIDQKPRKLSNSQQIALQALSRQVVNQLELRLEKINSENSIRIKEEALAIMAHEIRTPLSGIMGLSDIATNSDINLHEAKEYINRIHKCGQNLNHILNDVLDFTKLNSGNITLTKEPTLLDETIETIIESHKEQFLNKGINLKYNKVTSLYQGPLEIDRTRLGQVIQNLILNAYKFTEIGQVCVELDIRKQNKNFLVLINISDTGQGICPKDLEKLFQPYSQVDSSSTRKKGGTGLGLFICKNIINAMNGKITVNSQPNQGTEFVISFPTSAIKSQNSLDKKPSKIENQSLGLNVLVAEDNPTNQLIITKYLEIFDCKITIVENGLLAIKAYQNSQYDVILMDCMMPVMDGYSAAKEIIKNSKGPTSPNIIAVTANSGIPERRKIKESGMTGCLLKPLDKSKLFKVLTEIKSRKIKKSA